jgi:hypothetical protein
MPVDKEERSRTITTYTLDGSLQPDLAQIFA